MVALVLVTLTVSSLATMFLLCSAYDCLWLAIMEGAVDSTSQSVERKFFELGCHVGLVSVALLEDALHDRQPF